MEPEDATGGGDAAPTEVECPRCGSAASPHQEYCLECGARLPPPEHAAAGPAARVGSGARESLVTVLVAFLVAVLAAAAVVGVQMTRDDSDLPLLVETPPPPPEPAPETEPPPGETEEPAEADDPELPDEEAEAEPEPPPPPAQQQVIAWPEGVEGYTVILASLPTGGGRAPATARARQARDAGLPEVGVLASANFASLRPGYFVVFSGVHETRSDAEAALGGVRAAGNPEAYVAQITP